MKRIGFVGLVTFWFALSPLYGQIVFAAEVERVVDGDTLILRVAEVTYRARLHGVDAPETRQPWGPESTQTLRDLVVGSGPITVEVPDIDRYGRLIVKLYADGVYLNRKLVARGAAWHYTRYDDSDELAEAEQAARDRGIGLWSQPDPVAPWEWRRR